MSSKRLGKFWRLLTSPWIYRSPSVFTSQSNRIATNEKLKTFRSPFSKRQYVCSQIYRVISLATDLYDNFFCGHWTIGHLVCFQIYIKLYITLHYVFVFISLRKRFSLKCNKRFYRFPTLCTLYIVCNQGGIIGAYEMSKLLKPQDEVMLKQAISLADHLLPAFDTKMGIPKVSWKIFCFYILLQNPVDIVFMD